MDLKNINEWADFWRYQIGVNVIPADTKNKRPIVEWKKYQADPVPEEQHKEWKELDAFKDGMAIIAGKVWHNDSKRNQYLILVDLDNQKAIDEFCNRNGDTAPLTELANSNSIIVEQHKDAPDKAHIIFYATHPFPKKSSDVAALSTRLDSNQIPAIEVKGIGEHGLLFCTPSPHKNGHNYEIIGTTELDTVVDAFESHIDNICSKYGIPYLNGNGNNSGNNNNSTPIQELFKEDTKIYEGHNRHEALLRVMESLLRRNNGILKEDQIKQLASDWNRQHCIPPLDNRDFDKQWHDAVKFIDQHQQHQQTTGQRHEKYQELAGNVYYQINEKPEKYIIAYKQKKQLIETTARPKETEIDGTKIIEYVLYHNKTYLTCIPVKAVRHKNPLMFLESAAKYTISFVDAAGEQYTFSHKTLSEILSNLRDLGYVLSDGAEGALGTMIQAYKESKQIIDNEDMDYMGFFTDKDNKIIPSNIKITDPVAADLDDALAFLEELKQYYENRLDLLSTSIVWGMIAPAIFMLKTNNYFLKWLHFYGFPNATKSNTGKIVLAIDGHHDDPKFLLNIARIDTIARLGDTVSHTTFPKLVDEVDLNGERIAWLVNAIKSAIEGRIVRSKFPTNRATSSVDIPALSPLILTSNPPPPFHDSAYMRRVIERNFPQSETWKEIDQAAINFKEFLRKNLKRGKPLGDFRNWWIMHNQEIILDEAKPEPLDLGFKILSEAYKTTGRIMPEWLKLRLPENQLEESIEDNNVIVKRAFEKYITEEFNRALAFWRLQNQETMPNDISDRLVKLAQSNLLPDVKSRKDKYGLIIRKGVLTELYRHGVIKDQLPNLRALADYMGASFRKTDGNKVVDADLAQLSTYFDKN